MQESKFECLPSLLCEKIMGVEIYNSEAAFLYNAVCDFVSRRRIGGDTASSLEILKAAQEGVSVQSRYFWSRVFCLFVLLGDRRSRREKLWVDRFQFKLRGNFNFEGLVQR